MVGFAAPTKKRIQSVVMVEWMESLLKSKFFGPCEHHQELSKNEAKVFCIDCNRCICQHCSSSDSHMLHNLLQIRRYVYHDVVRYQDIHKHFDCSKVQTYTTNNAKVVFLNPRPQSRPSKLNSGGAFCEVCERSLTEPNQFCSVACKFSVSPNKSREQSDRVYGSFRFPEFSSLSMNDELNQQDHQQQQQQLSISNSYTGEMESSEDNQSLHSWLTHSNSPNSNSSSLKPKKQMHKRKGVPHRSPLS